ncbi:hypothetical protein OEZ86_007334 [Tetradesmus obliquus]|nr:hypothetical protein OEZ86_007334 [Tetradesmus obliquus]
MGKKRSYAEFAAGAAAEPTLTVLTADGGRIPAHNEFLRLVCSCLRESPASDTWDLSSLLVNGSPVSQSTVTAVLELQLGRGYGIGSIFGEVEYTEAEHEGDVAFTATLLQDFYEYRKGANVEVLFEVDGTLNVTDADADDAAGVTVAFGVVVGPDSTFEKPVERSA